MSNRKGIMKSQAGFTLVEVMIAMAVFSIGILAVISIQYMVVGGNTNGNVVTQQMMLGQRIMEQMKNTPNPVNITGVTLNNVDQTGAPGGPYDVNTTVTNPLGGNTSRFITVSVTRTGGVGGHPLTLRSMTHGSGI